MAKIANAAFEPHSPAAPGALALSSRIGTEMDQGLIHRPPSAISLLDEQACQQSNAGFEHRKSAAEADPRKSIKHENGFLRNAMCPKTGCVMKHYPFANPLQTEKQCTNAKTKNPLKSCTMAIYNASTENRVGLCCPDSQGWH